MRNYKHTYHTSLETIPIYRLNKVKESISNGIPEFRHLLVLEPTDPFPEIDNELNKELESAYYKMVEELEDVSTELVGSYRVYLESYFAVKKKEIQASLEQMKGETPNSIKYAQNNRDFKEYIDILQRDFTNFKIIEYYLIEDFKEVFEKDFPHLEFNRDFQTFNNEIQAFYTLDEYTQEVLSLNVSVHFKDIFLSESFMLKFIKSRLITITTLDDYIDRLRNGFMKNNNYKGYIDFRYRVFGLSKFSFEPGHVYDFYQEMTQIKLILGIDFDPHRIPAKEYLSYLNTTRAKIEREKKPDNAV